MPKHVDPNKYPKAKYHASLPNALVNDPDEEEALGEGWYDHPDQVKDVVAEPEPVKRGPGKPRKVEVEESAEE